MKVLSGVYWSVGAQKTVNQDTVVLQQVAMPGGKVVLAMVCDGIGGLPEGETAGGYMAEEMVGWFYGTGLAMIHLRRGRRRIIRSILRVFFRVQEEMEKYGERKGIKFGSTVTMLLIWRKRYLILHLGDSRIYLCGRFSLLYRKVHPIKQKRSAKDVHSLFIGKKIRQLTVDHCNEKGALTKCLGSFLRIRPDILWGRVSNGSGFLLCTDGFRNCVSIMQLAEAFRPGEIKEEVQIEARLREIAEYSMKKGEADNISAIYLKME